MRRERMHMHFHWFASLVIHPISVKYGKILLEYLTFNFKPLDWMKHTYLRASERLLLMLHAKISTHQIYEE